jgi:hypothetical protein
MDGESDGVSNGERYMPRVVKRVGEKWIKRAMKRATIDGVSDEEIYMDAESDGEMDEER